jgi:hypothetical protein
MRVILAFGCGLALLAGAVAVVLSGSPVAVIGANSTLANNQITEAGKGARACQGGETVPAGTSSIRLSLASDAGPRVNVKVLSGARVLSSGAVSSGWIGGSVSVPVRPLAQSAHGARVCFALGATREKVGMIGSLTSSKVSARGGEGEPLPGRLKIEYLRSSHSSWWSLWRTIARRMGLGKAPSGAWVALIAVLLMALAVAGASWLTVKELG